MEGSKVIRQEGLEICRGEGNPLSCFGFYMSYEAEPPSGGGPVLVDHKRSVL